MANSPYRAGPWPGLTPKGAAVLLASAVFLAAGQVLVGPPRRAWPDLLVLAVTAFVPLVLATRVVQAPGAAAAVCGAYLLPRTLISLIEPSMEPPPLLLVPALAFDVALWLRRGDMWPIRQNPWRRRDRTPRQVTWWRGSLAGGIFGLALALIGPPFAILLGGDAAAWSGRDLLVAALGSVFGCALIGSGARGTGS